MRHAALIVALACSTVAAATPGVARQSIDEAEARWRDLEYESALEAANRAAAAADATIEDKRDALRIAGSALVVLDRNDEAVATFERLFPIDPDYELPEGTSPRILTVFNPAHARWLVAQEEQLETQLGAQFKALRLGVQLPSSARGGLPIVIGTTLDDPGALVDRLVLLWRRRGTRSFNEIAAAPAPTVSLAIPGVSTASTSPYVLELELIARHRSGAVLRRQGTPQAPLTLAVAPGQPAVARPITHRWWFWTALGVAAAAAIVIPVAVTQTADVGPQHVVVRASP